MNGKCAGQFAFDCICFYCKSVYLHLINKCRALHFICFVFFLLLFLICFCFLFKIQVIVQQFGKYMHLFLSEIEIKKIEMSLSCQCIKCGAGAIR